MKYVINRLSYSKFLADTAKQVSFRISKKPFRLHVTMAPLRSVGSALRYVDDQTYFIFQISATLFHTEAYQNIHSVCTRYSSYVALRSLISAESLCPRFFVMFELLI